MQIKKFLSAALALFVFFAGCAKKQNQADSEFAQAPAVSQKSQSQDIFDEFYKDENGSSNSQNGYGTKQSISNEESKSAKSSYSPKFSQDGSIVIQISTLRSKKMADNLASKFNAKGYPSYVVAVQNPTPALTGSYYRVRIGAFKGIAPAREFGENILKSDGYEYWIDNKSNDNIGIEGSGLGEPGKSIYASPYEAQNTPAQTTTVPAAESIPASPSATPIVNKPSSPETSEVKPVSQQPGSPSTPKKSGTNEWGD
jgi:cell division septation protein DedD